MPSRPRTITRPPPERPPRPKMRTSAMTMAISAPATAISGRLGPRSIRAISDGGGCKSSASLFDRYAGRRGTIGRLKRETAAPAAIIALVFAALTAWSWRRWPDVLVDFGRELYVAWRLSEGDVLYRDVASFYGPLSPYVNALWFRVFGPGLVTLAWLNLALAAAVAAGLYALVRRARRRVARRARWRARWSSSPPSPSATWSRTAASTSWPRTRTRPRTGSRWRWPPCCARCARSMPRGRRGGRRRRACWSASPS